LYFYPRDNTPGCATEASQFNEELAMYREAGVEVVGVSTDDVSSHASFAESHDLEFDLLADPDGKIAEQFDVAVNNGRAERVTFVVVDKEVRTVYTGVKPDGHARTVLLDMIEDGIVDVDW
jgi:peroxiredoxin Q/BCP